MTENPERPSGYDAGYQAGYQAARNQAQNQAQGQGAPYAPTSRPSYRRLTRSSTDAPVSGVCGGLADYLRLDPTLVRVLVGVAMVVFFPIAEIVYVVMWAVIPKE